MVVSFCCSNWLCHSVAATGRNDETTGCVILLQQLVEMMRQGRMRLITFVLYMGREEGRLYTLTYADKNHELLLLRDTAMTCRDPGVVQGRAKNADAAAAAVAAPAGNRRHK
jgi:hypothetical protein